MHSASMTHEQLMQVSERRLQDTARAGSATERYVASRVLEFPSLWTRWEHEHSTLMRTVTAPRNAARQSARLKRACFSLIHRKALFEHLRDRQIGGPARQRLLLFFHRTRGYSQAMITEHGNYLRSACSYLCSSYVGSAVIRDGVYEDPMRRYEDLYSEYFRLFCEGTLEDGSAAASADSLLPYLKYQIREHREAIMAMPRMTPSLLRDDALRPATGDTEMLRMDALRAELGE